MVRGPRRAQHAGGEAGSLRRRDGQNSIYRNAAEEAQIRLDLHDTSKPPRFLMAMRKSISRKRVPRCSRTITPRRL